MKRLDYKRERKPLMAKIKKYIIIGLVLEGVLLYNNPVLLIKQVKAVQRHLDNRGHQITYNLIKEQRGETIANMWDSGQTFKDLSQSFNKCWRDTLSIFN